MWGVYRIGIRGWEAYVVGFTGRIRVRGCSKDLRFCVQALELLEL